MPRAFLIKKKTEKATKSEAKPKGRPFDLEDETTSNSAMSYKSVQDTSRLLSWDGFRAPCTYPAEVTSYGFKDHVLQSATNVTEDDKSLPKHDDKPAGFVEPVETIENRQQSADSPGKSRVLKKHKCEECQRSFSTSASLRKHQHPRKEFACKYCDKTYVSLGALKMHIRTHTLPCKCTICGKAFSRPWLLQGHIRTHTGEKPYQCPNCQRAFADRSNLRAHLQTHSAVKKYCCSQCTRSFSRMSLLHKHQYTCGAEL